MTFATRNGEVNNIEECSSCCYFVCLFCVGLGFFSRKAFILIISSSLKWNGPVTQILFQTVFSVWWTKTLLVIINKCFWDLQKIMEHDAWNETKLELGTCYRNIISMNKPLMTSWDGAVTKGMLHNVTEGTRAVRPTDIALNSICATCVLCDVGELFTSLSLSYLFVCNMENVTNMF